MRNIFKLSSMFNYLSKIAKGNVVSFDFDDTLWLNPGWNEYYLDKLKKYIEEGYHVVIVTARDSFGAREAKKLLSGIGIYIDVYSAPGNRYSLDKEENITKSDVLIALNAIKHYDDMPYLQDLNKAKRFGIEIIQAAKGKTSVAKNKKSDQRHLMTEDEINILNNKISIKFSDGINRIKKLQDVFYTLYNIAKEMNFELIIPNKPTIDKLSNDNIGSIKLKLARIRSDYEVYEFGKDRLIKITNAQMHIGWIKLQHGYEFSVVVTHIPGTEIIPSNNHIFEDNDSFINNENNTNKQNINKQLNLFDK